MSIAAGIATGKVTTSRGSRVPEDWPARDRPRLHRQHAGWRPGRRRRRSRRRCRRRPAPQVAPVRAPVRLCAGRCPGAARPAWMRDIHRAVRLGQRRGFYRVARLCLCSYPAV